MRRQEEEAEFKEFAARPDATKNLFSRIAPQIFGGNDIKRAVACLLFGGSRKVGRGPPQARDRVGQGVYRVRAAKMRRLRQKLTHGTCHPR